MTDQERARLTPEEHSKYGRGQDTGQDAARRRQAAVKLIGLLGPLYGDPRVGATDRAFIAGCRMRMNAEGSRWQVGGKQLFWLQDIYAKATERGLL